MRKNRKPLTKQQLDFIDGYMETADWAKAASAAGITPYFSKKWREDPEILAAIDRRIDERDRRMHLDDDFELERLLELLDICLRPQPVFDAKNNQLFCEDGRPVLRCDSKGANAALLSIAKLRGKLTKKVEIGIADNLAQDLERVYERIAQDADKAGVAE